MEGSKQWKAWWSLPSCHLQIEITKVTNHTATIRTVEGLVISVGGLSESVVTQSSTALLRWLRACKSARNLRAVAGLALRLVGMFGDAKGNPRIVVPLLKTLEV